MTHSARSKQLKILLTGGGTAGHIHPLIAATEEILELLKKEDVEIEIRYFGPRSAFLAELENKGIRTVFILGAKLRRYFSFLNFLDIFKFALSLFQALFKVYFFMPDIVFSKGGPGSLPIILAAKIYFIPIIIHESDAVPGLANQIASRWARKIMISFEKSFAFFPKEKTILSGNPIRRSILEKRIPKKQAKEELGFNSEQPLILVLGGSQGAARINNFILDNLREILKISQIIHQVGYSNFDDFKKEFDFYIQEIGSFYKNRCQIFPYLNEEKIKMCLTAADLIVSRAGAGAIFEIAAFSRPSILIPLETSAANHQKINGYEYSKSGACIIIEEPNFKPNIFLLQAQKVLKSSALKEKMVKAASKFAKPRAAEAIAKEIIETWNMELGT